MKIKWKIELKAFAQDWDERKIMNELKVNDQTN